MIRSIVRTRNTRIGRMFRRIKPAGPEVVLSDVQFETELKKEIYRSDRRAFARDLGLVRLKMDAISNEFFVSLVGIKGIFRFCCLSLIAKAP